MSAGTSTADSDRHGPTVYTVLAESARSHSRRRLAIEAVLAGSTALLLLVRLPRWWPIASLALAVSLYALWGLLERSEAARSRARSPRKWERIVRVAVAALATAAVLAGLAGLALKAFWGNAPGPYGLCYEPDGTSYACNADGSRRARPG